MGGDSMHTLDLQDGSTSMSCGNCICCMTAQASIHGPGTSGGGSARELPYMPSDNGAVSR